MSIKTDSALKAVIARLHNLLPSLNESEQAVAREVLANPEQVVQESIQVLAQRVGVSTSSVLRFCQRLDLSGFSDFKLALARELGRADTRIPEDVSTADTPLDVLHKVFELNQQALRHTLQLLDKTALLRAVDALDAAGRIEVYSAGLGSPLATSFYYRLLTAGLPAISVSIDMMQVSAAQLDSQAVALVISHKGRTKATLEAAQYAKDAGATVIALTSFLHSPLNDLADISLVTATTESALGKEALASHIAQLSILDTLYVALTLKRLDTAKIRLEQTNVIVERARVP